MKRSDFVRKLHKGAKGIYPNDFDKREDSRCTLYLDINEIDHEKDFAAQIDFIFGDFLKENNIFKKDILSKIPFEKRIDEDYIDEVGDDAKSYKYMVYFDSNQFFDKLVEEKVIKSQKTFIYRIENDKQSGLYAGIGLKLLQDFDNQQAPYEDTELRVVFSDQWMSKSYSRYHKDWIFGFQNLEKTSKWLNDEKVLDALSKEGLKIVKYELQDTDVVHGVQQSIFKKDKAKKVDELSLNILLEKKNPTVRNTLTI